MHRLAWAFAASLCNNKRNHVQWSIIMIIQLMMSYEKVLEWKDNERNDNLPALYDNVTYHKAT